MEDESDAMLLSLIEKEIPEGRNALIDSYSNLAVLSDYCKDNYANSTDKTKSLEETKAYASQSLASVAYQIHSLAVNILQMMDQQTIQLQRMQSNANNIGLVVDIHKEKVARREIGILTSSKNFSRSHKIVAPPQQEKPQRYKREEIDYSILDNIGHGVKTEKLDPGSYRRPSTSSSSGSVKAISLSSVHSSSQGSLKNPQSSLYQSVTSNSASKLIRMADNSPMPARPPVAPVAPVAPTTPRNTPVTVEIGAPKNVPAAPPPPPPPPPPPTDDDLPMPPPAPMFQIPRPDYDHDDTSLLPPPPEMEDLYQIPTSNAAIDDLPPPPPDLDDFSSPTHAMPPPPPPPPVESSEQHFEKVIAIYDYHKLRDDELELVEGDIISVIKKNDDGWFEGVKDGIQGLFPGNYVSSPT